MSSAGALIEVAHLSAGYDVDYREFPGGHSVPADLARAAFDRLIKSRG